MNDLLRIKTIKKFFEFDEFGLFANSFSSGLMVMNENGRISLANDKIQTICFSKKESLTPFLHYTEIIDSQNSSMIDLIGDTLEFKRDFYRQISHNDRIYLGESKPVFKDKTFVGCTISLVDITTTITKEHQHELLYQVSTALSGQNSVNQLLEIAVSQLASHLPYQAVNIMLLDRQSKTLKIAADSNKYNDSYAEKRTISLGEGIAGRAAEELKPYSVYDISKSELFSQKHDDDRGALLVIPIATKGNIYGVLNIRDSKPRYFTENEVQFLTIVANEIAVAIENSLLYQRLKRRIQLLYKVFWASSFIGADSIDSRMQRIAKLIPGLFESEGCAVYLYSPKTNLLTLKYHSETGTRLPTTINFEEEGIDRHILHERETVIINKAYEHTEAAFLAKCGIDSLIAIPIYINNRPIGLLKVFNKKTGHYDDEDKTLSTIIAHRIATKLENAHLIRRVESEKELLNNIIENTSEGVVVINRRHKIVVWNQYMENITGLKKSEVLAIPAHKVFYSQLGLKALTKSLYGYATAPKKQGRATHSEHQMKTVSGEKVWVGTISSHILDDNKSPAYTILVVRNISQEKEFIQAKDDFVSITTHELRTPLTAIKGYLSMLNSGDAGVLTPNQKNYFAKAYSATERLSQLIEELLYVFRIDEDRLEYQTCTFLLNDLIGECIQELNHYAEAKHIDLSFKGTVPIIVKADPVRTKQVIANLIDNGIKYTKNKGKVVITMKKRDHDVVISVQDTGVGIAEKHLTTVFDRFVRIPNPLSVKAGGAGLGLYIVKNLVEKQGGTIWATSQIGKETTFHFTLPLAHTAPDSQKGTL